MGKQAGIPDEGARLQPNIVVQPIHRDQFLLALRG
jgi:hypothetical protein